MLNARKLFECLIPGQPIGKGRARAFIRHGRIGQFTPEKTVRWESHAAMVIQQSGAQPTTEPVRLEVEARFERPGRLKTRKLIAARDVPHIAKPDADNIVKAVCDALEKSGAVHNDSQVYQINVAKTYADADQAPGVTIRAYVQ